MSKRNIIKYAQAMVEAGVMERPLWLDAVMRVGVSEPKPGRRPPRIDFPEDNLLRVYYNKYPEARLEPIELTSFEPPTARRFVARQAQLMQEEGLGRKEAFARVEQEFLDRGENPGGSAASLPSSSSSNSSGQGVGSIIEQIQVEEEAELNAALQTYVDRNGPLQAPQRRPPQWAPLRSLAQRLPFGQQPQGPQTTGPSPPRAAAAAHGAAAPAPPAAASAAAPRQQAGRAAATPRAGRAAAQANSDHSGPARSQ